MKLLYCFLLLSLQCLSQSYSIYNKGNLSIYDNLTDTGRCCILKNGSYTCTVNLDKQHMIWKNEIDFVWVNSQYACLHIFSDEEFQSLLFVPVNNTHKIQYFSAAKRPIIKTDSINNTVCYTGKMTDDSVQVIFRNLLTEKTKTIYLKREFVMWPGFDQDKMKLQHDSAVIKEGDKNIAVTLKGLY